MKRSIKFRTLYYLLSLPLIFGPMLPAKADATIQQDGSDAPQTLVEHLREVNLNSIRSKSEYFSTNSYHEYLCWLLKKTLNPKRYDLRDYAFRLLAKQEKKSQANETFNKDNVTTWKNLDLFCPLSGTGNYIAQNLDRTQTEIGKVVFYHLLTTPTTDIKILQKRQSVINCLMNDEKLLEDLRMSFSHMKEVEGPVVALWGDHNFRQSLEHKYFKAPGMMQLNRSSSALYAKNVYDHTMNITGIGFKGIAVITLAAYGLVCAFTDAPDKLKAWAEDYKGAPSILFSHLWKIKYPALLHSALALLGSYFCACQITWNIRWEKCNFLLDKIAHIFTQHQAQYIAECRNIYKKIKSTPALMEFDEIKEFINFFEKGLQNRKELYELITLGTSNTFYGEPSIFSNKGKVFRMYELLLKEIESIETLICSVGKLEAYYSCAKLCKEFQEKHIDFCFANYEHAEKPFVSATDFWHPLIDTDVVIPNSIELGTNNNRPNMVITGPNAGGKSCIIKALALCLLSAQTIGIAPAKALHFTPFSSIATYLNITDDINEGNSLFKAEVERAQNLINNLEKSNPTDFHFLVFDEIFNGTSFLEGTAAAYGCAKYLGKFKNSLNIIATHFPIIANLEKETETYSNYKVSVNKKKDGSISYPYKLEKGISDQHVALDILKNEGFDCAILEEAEKVAGILRN